MKDKDSPTYTKLYFDIISNKDANADKILQDNILQLHFVSKVRDWTSLV